MTGRDAYLIVVGFFALLGTIAYLGENTEQGRRITARLLTHFIGEPAPQGVYRCCLSARAGSSEAGYYLHRVREHGEGAA
jgi:hypothetical protein